MLETTIFLSGAMLMVLEMVGARVLAPHVGTSAIVWTSLIGVMLAFLALGSWAGGRFADRHLSGRGLAATLAGAALGCALTALGHTAVAGALSRNLGNLYLAAVASAAAIFAIPAFFFGAISPYIIRLRMASLASAGATVGRLYALSTAGSILGTFLGGFILISFMGSSAILWSLALAMLLLSLLNWRRQALGRLLLLALCSLLCAADLAGLGPDRPETLLESPYNSIRIMDGVDHMRGGRPVRLMATDPGYSQSGMLTDSPEDLYFDYTRFYALGPWLKPDAKSALMLGGGGYSVPKWLLSGKSFLAKPEDLRLTVVELDPAMTAAARDFFGLREDARMRIVHEDGRSFLNRLTDVHDLIFVDVFNSHYAVPFQMGTRQAARQLARALAPDGVLLMNIISAGSGEDGRLLQAIAAGMAEAFGEITLYAIGRPDRPDLVQNFMLMARHGPVPGQAPAFTPPDADPGANEIRAMNSRITSLPQQNPAVPPLDDDFAPVERYTLMLARQ